MSVIQLSRETIHWFVAVAVALTCSTSLAQSDFDAEAVYAKAREAKTIDELTGLITDCKKAREDQLSEALDTYVKQLTAWLLNRRGEVHAERASALAEQNKSSEANEIDAKALADFEEALTFDPKQWRAIHNRGVNRAMQNNFEGALVDFTRVLELKPDYAKASFNRAEIAYELGRFDEALNDYTRVIDLDPSDTDAYTRRGHTHFQLLKFREALNDYHRVVQVKQNDAVAYADRGDAYRSLGVWEQAANDYRRAIDLNENLGRAYQSAAWLMATCPDARFRNTELALQAARKAIDIDGEADFIYLDTLAAAQANASEFDLALETLAKAVEVAPPAAHARLAERKTLYSQKKPYRQE